MYTIYYIRTYLKHIVVCIGSIGQTWKNIVLHLPNIIMQRDRDRETFWIHFTLIHRLALPGTTRSLTAMLLCMIAPGLDSSITAVSVRFFFHLKHPSLIRHGHSRVRQEPFWQRQIRKLLELLVPAPLACCQGLTSLSHYAVYPFPANFLISQRCSMS